MKASNIVSLWLGKFCSEQKFKTYVNQEFNEDGDVTSKFMNDFSINYYDHDFAESFFNESDLNAQETLLSTMSYSATFMSKVKNVKWSKYNSIVLIYDFEYNGSEILNNDESLEFIGTFKYEKNKDKPQY
jgi:hypothetical protein